MPPWAQVNRRLVPDCRQASSMPNPSPEARVTHHDVGISRCSEAELRWLRQVLGEWTHARIGRIDRGALGWHTQKDGTLFASDAFAPAKLPRCAAPTFETTPMSGSVRRRAHGSRRDVTAHLDHGRRCARVSRSRLRGTPKWLFVLPSVSEQPRATSAQY